MHGSVREFVRRAVRAYGLGGSVLEVGSYQENDIVRDLLVNATSYLGVDLREGPGVDLVIEPGRAFYDQHEATFDTVVCCEVLEHDRRPWVTLDGMATALKPGGILLVTCRGFGEHGAYGLHRCPTDYWRMHVDAMVGLYEDIGVERIYIGPDLEERTTPGVFALGRKH